MAATVKDVNIRIRVTDNFKQTEKGFDEVNKKTKQTQNSVSKLETSFNKLGTAMLGAFAVKAVIGDAVNRIKEFDQSVANLQAITGATNAEMKNFKKAILEVSASTGKGATEIAKAFQLVGSAKPELLSSAEALAAVTEQAVILSQAGGMEVPAAAEALTKAMNQFGAGAEDAAKFTDILATAQQKGTATIQQTSDALKNAGANANAAGLSFEETNVAIQALAKGGLVGSEAGTGLSAALIKLSNQADTKINPSLNSMKDVVNELASRNLTLKDATKLVGAESAKTLLTLTAQKDVVNELTGELNEAGNAQKQAALITSTLGEEMDKLDSAYGRVILQMEDGSGTLANTIKHYVTMTTEILGLIEALEKGEGALEAMTEMGTRQLVESGRMTEEQAKLTNAYAANADNIEVLNQWLEKGTITQDQYKKALQKLVVDGWQPATKETEANTEAVEENGDVTGTATGSLKDYEDRIKKLTDAMKEMRIGSDAFVETKDKIAALKDEVALLSSGLTEDDFDVEPVVKKYGLGADGLEMLKDANDKETEIVLESMKERNELIREETAANHQMAFELDQKFLDAKQQLNQELGLSALGLAATIAQAAGDSQEAQIAALTFQKLAAFASIVINTNTAIAAAVAPPPIGLGPLAGGALVPGIIAKGAIQGATVLATAIPQIQSIQASGKEKKLKDGEVRIQGPGTTTSDSIPALLSREESVINAKSSIKHEAALRAINDDRFDDWLQTHITQELYMRTGKGIMNNKRAGGKGGLMNFPNGFAVTNPSAISGPIAKAMEEQNFLNRNGWA